MIRIAATAIALGGIGIGVARGAAAGYQPPPQWRELPALVADLPAASDRMAIASRGAWGDPSAGCFLIGQVATAGPGATAQGIYRAMAEGLGESGFRGKPANVAADGSEARLELTGGAFTVMVLATASGDATTGITARVATCFFNQRQPESSRQLCEQQLKRFVAAR